MALAESGLGAAPVEQGPEAESVPAVSQVVLEAAEAVPLSAEAVPLVAGAVPLSAEEAAPERVAAAAQVAAVARVAGRAAHHPGLQDL